MKPLTTESTSFDVIVIGGGHNGLTAAALLAGSGRKVLLLERHLFVGGLAVGDEFHPQYRSVGLLHDTSAVRPHVIEALKLERHGLTLTAAPPPVFLPQRAGRGLWLHHDAQAAAGEIEAFSKRDARRYAEYRGFLARISRFTRRLFDEPPPDLSGNGLSGLTPLAARAWRLRRLGRRDMMELLRIGPMCVADWLGEWFETDLLRSALAAPAIDGTFTGPRSPGSAAMLLRSETMAERSAAGGPVALIDALEKSARSSGVSIRTGAEVRRIRIGGGRVEGVELADGEFITARVVAASCDPKRVFLGMIDGEHISDLLAHRIHHFRSRGTTAKVNLALNRPLRFACRPDLRIEHARIGETLDEMERAFDAVKYGRFSSRPILDVYVPTLANPDLAPPGHCVVSVVAHFAPYELKEGWSDETREELGDAVMGVLSEYSPDIEESIVAREVQTPMDIEARYGVTEGHLHHGEHALDQFFTRPCPECARYRTPIVGLHLCGSGSHPGGGLTCGPGALCASIL